MDISSLADKMHDLRSEYDSLEEVADQLRDDLGKPVRATTTPDGIKAIEIGDPGEPENNIYLF